jgi:hypothetical protein
LHFSLNYSHDQGNRKIVADVLELPPYARAFVTGKFMESLDMEPSSDLSQAWKEEIKKRCREMDEGLVERVPAEDVYKQAFSALK